MRSFFVQTVEDHILADAVIAMSDILGRKAILSLNPDVTKLVMVANAIAQKRRTYTVHQDNGTPLLGRDLTAAVRRCFKDNIAAAESILFR